MSKQTNRRSQCDCLSFALFCDFLLLTDVSGIIRPPSIREPNSTSGAVPVTNPAGITNCPRKLFGRLGIRKSSLLSLTSPQRPDRATSRTFSLDDLLRPPPRSKIGLNLSRKECRDIDRRAFFCLTSGILCS